MTLELLLTIAQGVGVLTLGVGLAALIGGEAWQPKKWVTGALFAFAAGGVATILLFATIIVMAATHG